MGNTVPPCTPLEKMKYEPCIKVMGESECEVNHVLNNTDKILSKMVEISYKWIIYYQICQ